MLISRNWLQIYFEKPLPKTEELVRGLTMHAFEIEGVEKKVDDEILDVKVLPNRAHDCLCHYGIAKEVSAIFEMKMKLQPLKNVPRTFPQSNEFSVEITTEKVNRFKVLVIRDVKIQPSPKWLKERIEAMGGKSINNVVDITNFVMFELNQPLHAFDKNKVSNSFIVCEAKNGQKILTLDGVERELKEGALLITDGESKGKNILGIAGIKGGGSSEITDKTTDIILEAANFDAPTIRRHAKLLNLRTDASVRFENAISPELPGHALDLALKLIEENAKGDDFQVEGEFDFYPKKQAKKEIEISVEETNNILGTKLTQKEIEEIYDRLEFTHDGLKVEVPFERLDLEIKEDLAEEIGRVYGLEHIESVLPPALGKEPEINEEFNKCQKIREALVRQGYSEVYTYAMRESGEVEIENPIASDKSFMRKNLGEGIKKALELNSRNAPLLGLDEVKIFEIGKVFSKSEEVLSICTGIFSKGKINLEETTLKDTFPRFNLGSPRLNLGERIEIKYKTISQYPFALRDIALWVPENVSGADVEKIIKEMAGDNLARCDQFDEFKKDEKSSYAYHLVFQSNDRTLNDVELNEAMEKVTQRLNSNNGWEVR